MSYGFYSFYFKWAIGYNLFKEFGIRSQEGRYDRKFVGYDITCVRGV